MLAYAILLACVGIPFASASERSSAEPSDQSVAALVHVLGFDGMSEELLTLAMEEMQQRDKPSPRQRECMESGLRVAYRDLISDKVKRGMGSESDARAWIEFGETVHGGKFLAFVRSVHESMRRKEPAMTIEEMRARFDVSDAEMASIKEFLSSPAGLKLRTVGEIFKLGDEGASTRVAAQCGMPPRAKPTTTEKAGS